MNQRTQYLLIGSAGTAILVLVILLLPQNTDVPPPITPIAEEIVSDQNDTNDDVSDDDTEELLDQGLLPVNEEMRTDETIEVLTLPYTSSGNVFSSRSGGGGGGGGSDDNDDEDFSYGLDLFEGEQDSDGIIDLGQDIRAVASTDDDIDKVIFRWIDPQNNVTFFDTVELNSGQASSEYKPDMLGMWVVEADFGNGNVVVETLQISFLVIPESPVGVIALVATSIVTIGAYALIRSRKC